MSSGNLTSNMILWSYDSIESAKAAGAPLNQQIPEILNNQMVSKTNVKKPPGGILPEQIRAGSHVGNYSGVVRSSNLSPNLENTAAISKSTFGIKQQKKEEIKKSKNMPQGLFQSPSKGSTGVSGI